MKPAQGNNARICQIESKYVFIPNVKHNIGFERNKKMGPHLESLPLDISLAEESQLVAYLLSYQVLLACQDVGQRPTVQDERGWISVTRTIKAVSAIEQNQNAHPAALLRDALLHNFANRFYRIKLILKCTVANRPLLRHKCHCPRAG